MRLLPKDQETGWTRYVWLVYLLFVPIYPFFLGDKSAARWAATIGGMAVFLVLFFWGYWLKGRKLLWIVLAITLLGVGFAPFNPGSSVYFVYAAAFLCQTGDAAFAYRLLLVLMALLGLESWILHLPANFWIFGELFTLLIGAVNIHTAERRRH